MDSLANKGGNDINIGGLREILFMPLEFITAMWQLANGLYDLDLFTYKDVDVKWYVADFIKESARFTEQEAVGANGPYFKQKVEFSLARDYAFRTPLFNEMQEYEFAVVAVDSNGLPKLIGAMDANGDKSGMRFFTDSDTGIKFTDRNEIQCYFYKESSKRASPAYFETHPEIVEPPKPPGGSGWPIGTLPGDEA